MPIFADGRIPLRVVADEAALGTALAGGGPAALLAESAPAVMPAEVVATAGFDPAAPHPAGCACCTGRAPMAQALDALFLDRVKGRAPWFDRVVAWLPSAERQAEMDVLLALDPVVSARFRAGG